MHISSPDSNIAYAGLMAATSLMFGSLAHFYEKPVVVIATSCAGTLAVLYGKSVAWAQAFLRGEGRDDFKGGGGGGRGAGSLSSPFPPATPDTQAVSVI